LWIVGVSEQEVLAIKMLADHQAPMVTQKGEIRRFQLRVPLLNQKSTDVDSKEKTQPQLECDMLN